MHPSTDHDHERFMQMAIDLSEIALDTGKGGPFGAIIIKQGHIIGSSGNCVFRNTDPTSHAEIMAIRDACENIRSADLSGSIIYSSAEPCPMCLAAIYWARIDQIFYANTEADSLKYGFIDKVILAELRKDPQHRRVPSKRIAHPDAIRVFQKGRKKGIKKQDLPKSKSRKKQAS